MQVFKFGGASISNIDRIKDVIHIVKQERDGPLLIVMSAMGKTTNALEKVATAFFEGRYDDAHDLYNQVKQQHETMAKYLLVNQYHTCMTQFNDLVTEAEWMLHDEPVRDFDYYYDQIVCLGELMTTIILAHTFKEEGVPLQWMDVRDLIRTNDNFRDAGVIWEHTKQNVDTLLLPALQQHQLVLTQGFIGCTDENESTTLGREGSDYTAAIFGNLLHGEKVVIWKDVDAVLNADPRQFPEAEPIHQLNYDEVIEMAYYGAQVIHPKTIKPLVKAKIPLWVRSFINPLLKGTIINDSKPGLLPPIIVQKSNQVLMTFRTLDYSFATEEPLDQWNHWIRALYLRPNMMQTGAIQFMAVFDDKTEKLQELALQASGIFDVQMRKGLTLLTIRHYTQAAIDKYINGKNILVTQKTPDTIQVLMTED